MPLPYESPKPHDVMLWMAAEVIRAAAPELGRAGSRRIVSAVLKEIERAGYVVVPRPRTGGAREV